MSKILFFFLLPFWIFSMNYLNWDMQFMLGLSAAARLVLGYASFFPFPLFYWQPKGGLVSLFKNVDSNRLSVWYFNSVRVSNELGASHPKVAKLSVIVVNTNSIIISIFFSAIILIFKVGLSKLFTNDAEVIEAVSNLTPLLAISVFLNGIQPILSGIHPWNNHFNRVIECKIVEIYAF